MKRFRAAGYIALRAPASLGVCDVIALKDGGALLLEVKSTTTPFAHFGPEDRAALLRAGRMAGAEVALCYWPKGQGQPELIGPNEWPPDPA